MGWAHWKINDGMEWIHYLCKLPTRLPISTGVLIPFQATVLLNANVAFLAVPGVNYGSATQIASYLSVITSIGSIITGLLLTRQYRDRKDSSSAEEAVCLPILVSINTQIGSRRTTFWKVGCTLPEGSRHWGSCIRCLTPYLCGREHKFFACKKIIIDLFYRMVTFLLAFSLKCFVLPSYEYKDIPVIVAWALVAGLVIWCVITGWDSENPSYPAQWIKSLRTRARGMFRKEGSSKIAGPAAKTSTKWLPRRFSSDGSSTMVESPVNSSNLRVLETVWW